MQNRLKVVQVRLSSSNTDSHCRDHPACKKNSLQKLSVVSHQDAWTNIQQVLDRDSKKALEVSVNKMHYTNSKSVTYLR